MGSNEACEEGIEMEEVLSILLIKKLKKKGVLTELDVADLFEELVETLYPDWEERKRVLKEIAKSLKAEHIEKEG